jgi:hypothetical protein
MLGHPRAFLLGAIVAVAGCGASPTGPTITEIQQQQAAWATHNLTRYAYQYMTTGFSTALDGHAMRLVVLGDTVRSAQFVATNDSVPVAPSTLPTIDALFGLAISAAENGTLVSAQFDSALGYPRRLQISGLPDASGVIVATNIELLP